VGKSRVRFNAHQIHAPEIIIEYLSELDEVELFGVHDYGRFMKVDL